jgi:iron complex transport system ATP-binding protein
MPAIRTENLSFGYNGCRVLNGVCLSVDAGERVAIIGPNGAGKTTLLKLLSGVLNSFRGSITIQDRNLATTSRSELARTLAMVPQEFSVPFDFTVREVVELGRTAHIKTLTGFTDTDRTAVEEALHLTDITFLRNRIFNQLSGGERRRAVLAMALAQKPKILLLDEPTQHLDIARQADILDLVTALSREAGLTVVAAIHDLNLAARYFQRLMLLHNGSIEADGDAYSVLGARLLERIYGRPIEVLTNGDSFPFVFPKFGESQ